MSRVIKKLDFKERKGKKGGSYRSVWVNNCFALKILFGATPLYGCSVIVEAIRHNLINFLEQTVCVYMVLNAVENGGNYVAVLKAILIFLVIDLSAASISNLYEHYIKLKFLPKAQQRLKSQLYEKARKVDISNYDNSEYYNNFVLAVSESDKVVERAEQIIRMFFGSCTVMICYGVFFFTQDVISVLFVCASFILRTIFLNMSNKLRYRVRIKEISLERKRDYIRRIFFLKEYSKEIRLNKDITKTFHEQFDEIHENLYSLRKHVAVQKFMLDFIAKYIATDFMFDIIYVLYLIICATIYHLISFSSVVVLYNSAANLRRGLSTVIDLGPYALETSLYIEKIRAFLDSKSNIDNKKIYVIPKKTAIFECKDVSFGYDVNHLILKNVNLTIHPKEKIALVGYNGAGKTTLIKLLLRLYDPTEGVILLNGKDIKGYDIEEYRRYIGVVFQDFQLYATTLEQNITMDLKKDGVENSIVSVIKKSGFFEKYQTLKYGLNTEITREFNDNGTELSGGEGQKIAVARTFYENAKVMLLDEPSSALDPIAEYELNIAMNTMAKDKTVIFISHRLSTTRRADKIYVLNDGEIIEEGTHESLLLKKGVYYQNWNAQSGKYKQG